MSNYQLGKIYKIVCCTSVYYGSTCEPTLAMRLSGHLGHYRRWKNGIQKGKITSFEVLENDNYTIVLVELTPCNSKRELHQRERFYIENNICVNKCTPASSRKETQIKSNAKHYLKCKEKKDKQCAEYYKNNKEAILK